MHGFYLPENPAHLKHQILFGHLHLHHYQHRKYNRKRKILKFALLKYIVLNPKTPFK